MKQKTLRLEYMENTTKQQQQELRKRLDQVSEFEKVRDRTEKFRTKCRTATNLSEDILAIVLM